MSYIALARKYRPQTFSQVVGQASITSSLASLLDAGKLHHCYLFSGTRGVGKTTLARVIAKAVNCAKGISGSPCNDCENCKEITSGSFIDVIEIDAASRTKVEDTRDMLEQVRYLPNKGRRKVYIIDEVHMLSQHSFNALLKTLEEPPEYVCFILATTHPQKIPSTIISRCLHYELMSINAQTIQEQLSEILEKEGFDYEAPALSVVAKQARGSMRDALSLLERSLGAASGNKLQEESVSQLLGVGSKDKAWQLASLVLSGDVNALLDHYKDMQRRAFNAVWLLDSLLDIIQELAIGRTLGVAEQAIDWLDIPSGYENLTTQASAEQFQLYYQILLHAKRDLPFMPDEIRGIEMILLRLVAFSPVEVDAEKSSLEQEVKKKA